MTPQEINERIAKLCGWKQPYSKFWTKGGDVETRPPDYCHSLDACREFETEIDAKEWSDALLRVIQDKRSMLSAIDARYCTATATPIERCEAFLRMKGQWE